MCNNCVMNKGKLLWSGIEQCRFNPFPNKPWFLLVYNYKSFDNTVGKGEIARHEQFLIFRSVFYPFGELSAVFIKFEIVVCKPFLFGRV